MSKNTHKTHIFRTLRLSLTGELTTNFILSFFPSLFCCHCCQEAGKRRKCENLFNSWIGTESYWGREGGKCALTLDWTENSIVFWLGFFFCLSIVWTLMCLLPIWLVSLLSKSEWKAKVNLIYIKIRIVKFRD